MINSALKHIRILDELGFLNCISGEVLEEQRRSIVYCTKIRSEHDNGFGLTFGVFEALTTFTAAMINDISGLRPPLISTHE